MAETKVTYSEMYPDPRLRVNRTTALTMSTSFQRIDFSGTSSLNINTFPVMADGNQAVTWDSTNKLFKFNTNDLDRNFDMRFGTVFQQGISAVNIQLRYVVPAPVPLYFPFPSKADDATLNGRGYTDLIQLPSGVGTDYGTVYKDEFYSNALVRQYGIGVELKASAALLTQAILNSADFSILG